MSTLQTTGWRHAAAIAGLTTVTAMGFQIGTGGALTEQYYKQRGLKGYSYARCEGLASRLMENAFRTPLENLARIREVLKPATTELASLFGVSRQALYGWQDGTQPSAAHISKLEDLAKAADILANEGVVGHSQVLRRKLSGGNTLFETVREGGSAEGAARALAGLLRHELTQRRRLDSRLAGRAPKPLDLADAGSPDVDDRP